MKINKGAGEIAVILKCGESQGRQKKPDYRMGQGLEGIVWTPAQYEAAGREVSRISFQSRAEKVSERRIRNP